MSGESIPIAWETIAIVMIGPAPPIGGSAIDEITDAKLEKY